MGWGGRRPGAGRKPNPAKLRRRATSRPDEITPPSIPAEPNPPGFDGAALMAMLPQIEEISKRYAINKAREMRHNPFQLPVFPEAARPPKQMQMAMDSMPGFEAASSAWLAGSEIAGLSGEGLLFLGYTYLSELAQRPEYRVISETIADDATRRWIDFDVVGGPDAVEERRRRMRIDPEGERERMADPDERRKRVIRAGKMDKVKALKDDQLRLGVKDRFYEQARNDGFFGRSHLFLQVDTNGNGLDDPTELTSPIGDGRDETSRAKVTKGSFRSLQTIEPVWTYPLAYNAINPLRQDWYNPQVWYVMGQQIHGSRLQTFIGHPVPDMLKPAYAFGGLSLTQMAKPYVDIWLQTRQSVSAIIHSFSVMVLMTDLSTMMQPGNAGALLARVALFNMLRDNQGTFLLNKNTEDFKNVSAPLSGLHELQAQAQEHMASVSRIPLVKLTGIQPAGLNASSEGEIKVYDDTIMAYQSRFFAPNLSRVINFQQLSLFEEIDPEITWHFEPLREMTQAEKGQKQKDDADRDQKYVDMGALSPGEVRNRIADDPDLPYADIDPDDVPEPPAEEDPFGGAGPDNDNDPADGKEAAEADDLDPFFGARDADWRESDHPRAPDGKFGSGGASSESAKASSESAKSTIKSNIGSSISPMGLRRVGQQMGSNPGGVFENGGGERFYVKKPQSKAHVRNEMLAAALYGLAGSPTLKYRPVEGGEHVATEMTKLDKDRAQKLSTAEREAAQEQFMVHAWLGNYDAVGTGGDNLGTVAGVPTALDLGGALAYRARGAPKGAAFGDKVTEIDTMRDPRIAPDAAAMFGKMTDDQLRESAGRVARVPDDAIKRAVRDAGEPAAMADKLIARKRDIARRFGMAADAGFNESDHPRDEGGKFATTGATSSASPPAEASDDQAREWYENREVPEGWWVHGRSGQFRGEDDPLATGNVIQMTRSLDVADSYAGAAGSVFYLAPGDETKVVDATGDAGEIRRAFERDLERGALPHELDLAIQNAEAGDDPEKAWEAVREGFDPPNLVDSAGWFDTGVVNWLSENFEGALFKLSTGAVALDPSSLQRHEVKKVDGATDEAPFDESKHPRDSDGKFTSGGGSSGGASPSFKSKKDQIGHMLSSGTTPKEVMTAMGWPSVSMPQQAAALGMKLEKYTENGVTKYKGIPLTDAEKEALKKAAAEKKSAKKNAPPSATTPTSLQAPSLPAPTQQELNQAKKSTALAVNLVPGDKPTSGDLLASANSLVKAFNDKYAGKSLTDPAALAGKVADFKAMQQQVNQLGQEQKKQDAAKVAKAKAEAEAKAKAEAAKAAEEAKRNAERNKKVMAELGISAQQAEGVVTLAKMLGSKTGDIVEKFKAYEQHAKNLGYPITGFQCALIKNYSNGGYTEINKKLRSGAWTPAQHAYVAMVNKALDAMPKHTGVVRRGASLTAAQIERYQVGHIVQEQSFTSTAAKGQGFGGNVRFVINAIGKRGASIQKLSNHPHESEVLFMARTFFNVTKKETAGGVTTIHMDEWEEH